ncbi:MULTISPECIES: CHAT domain-containing tetratricopeptide repeat protein [unclassified Novosphingobium]|uniref:CHAT domain-containing protein n=1 Tax=unclassified Novosphingobium TaxID=2644732 RepID=UPI0013579DB0|nr:MULTISPECIES: CHAT domain-containing tetratricopeptide repeat protein [unclassified Novosphingobium]
MRTLNSWLALLAAVLASVPAGAAQDPAAEIRAARSLASQCKYADAGERLVRLLGRRRLSPDLALLARQDAATFANERLDHDEAERQAGAALDLAAARYGADSAAWAQVAQNMAVALAQLGKREEAAALYARILPPLRLPEREAPLLAALLSAAEFERGRGHGADARALLTEAATLTPLSSIPSALRLTGWMRIAEADRRALDLGGARAALAAAAQVAHETNASAPRLALIRSGVALEAGALREALDLVTPLSTLPADRCDPLLAADVAQRLGTIHMLRREVPEAEAAFGRAAAALAPFGDRHDGRTRDIFYGMAVTARFARNFARSADLFDRATAESMAMTGSNSSAVAQVTIEKALMLSEAGQHASAMAAARKGLSISESTGESEPLNLAYAYASLGLVAEAAGDHATAEQHLRMALIAFEKTRGASFDLTPGLIALGDIALANGRLAEAEARYARALAIQEEAGGGASLALGVTYARLARLAEARGDGKALSESGQAVDVILHRLAIGEAQPWSDALAERRAARAILVDHLRLLAAAKPAGTLLRDQNIVTAALTAMQAANTTRAGTAIAQMASRLGQSDGRNAALLRERSDLMLEWRGVQDNLIADLGSGSRSEGAFRQKERSERQAVIAQRIGAIDTELSRSDPKLLLLVRSPSVELAQITNAIRPREAMVALIVGDRETYMLAVTPTDAALVRTGLGDADARRIVDRLRSGLDPQHWQAAGPPSFDAGAAFLLYRSLLAPLEPVLRTADTLLLVSDAPLSSLPLSVLLTAPPPAAPKTSKDYAALPWLVRRFALVEFPSVASIPQTKAVERQPGPHMTMLGVGDPLFRRPGPTVSITTAKAVQLAPLPDTRRELHAMADALGRGDATLLLGRRASEPRVRAMNLSGFALLAFATHGLVAGQIAGDAEPALALTSPRTPSERDDGFLSASEIARLRLDSDWVILSACNTAAADGAGAEPLSGLAKAFFYAGARSLLVSHWPVETGAAADLVTAAVRGALSTGSRAQGLRLSMLQMAGDASSIRSHPLFWAPFALVGR